MASLRITFTSMHVTNNGEWTGKGELYWKWMVDGNIIGQRQLSNPLKTADGETIQLSAATTVVKNAGDSLTVEGSASEKDNLDKDENDTFKDTYYGPNWGVGNYTRVLRDGNLDVSVNYKIELA
jgi:hypothetical protein